MSKRDSTTKPKQLFLTDLAYSGVPHHNQRLFSDYFLNNLLPIDVRWQEHWQKLKAEAVPIKERLKELLVNFAPDNNTNEAQTEKEWIRPALEQLGHTFEVQAELKVPGGTQNPDYIFYFDDVQRIANRGQVVDDTAALHGAFAVGDAKRWQRPLDQMLKSSQRRSDDTSNKNPAFQIFFYMLHSKLPWGILTNGQQWRLYHESTAYKLEIFYEVDLPDVLLADDVEPFLYFYAFFRRTAFEPGPLSLEQLLDASVEYAHQISENLRQQVYDALCDIAQGFLDHPQNDLTPTPETCRLLYGSSLVLLYRLLFILYAEARGLLPLEENKHYKQKYSLDAIKRDVAEELKEGVLVELSGNYWQRLKTLFASIERGCKPLNVTTFNGGLFDSTSDEFHQFLETYTLGDPGICQAIDKLARVNMQYIDYRDLAERHLGTIYEGLLEYNLRVATEPMALLRSNSKIVPLQEAPRKDIDWVYAIRKVYLVTDRGERKITGSYYTPDYVVKYMVEQTVGPALDEALAALDSSSSDGEKVQAVLSVNVLDPAMGSGHFPVEVVEYIARFIVELDVEAEDGDETSLIYWKRRVAQQCIYGTDINPLAVELAKLSLWLTTVAKDHPLNFLDHHLRPGNALVGSWINEIATEFRRKSKRRIVLSQANKQEEEDASPEAVPLIDLDEFRQDVVRAAEIVGKIEHNSGNTLEQVKVQEQTYRQMKDAFNNKYLRLASLKSALYYMDVSDDLWLPLAQFALGQTEYIILSDEVVKRLDGILKYAIRIAHDEKHCFHWELEFPDIFYDQEGKYRGDQAGFDVVIGNPPYVRQEQLWEDKPFFEEHYEVYQGTADLFVYFFAQGLRLLRRGGRLTYISSNTWLRTNSATKLRHYLRTQTTVEVIIDLGNNRIFADAPDLSPSIQVVRKALPPQEHIALAAIFARGESVKTFRDQLADKKFKVAIQDQADSGWQLKSVSSRSLLNKLLRVGKPLKVLIENGIYRGIFRGLITGLNEAFIVEQATRDSLVIEDPHCEFFLKPVLRGEDLRPWYQENEGNWLICIPSGWTQETFPVLKSLSAIAFEKLQVRYPGLTTYLRSVEETALQFSDQGQFWWEWGKNASNDTNLSTAFIIDKATYEKILADGVIYDGIIIPLSRGGTLSDDEEHYVVHIPYGWTKQVFPELNSNEALGWEKFSKRYPSVAKYLAPFAESARRRQDQGQYWWELRACDYYDVFEQSKILFPDITRKPRFSWGVEGTYINNTGYCVSTSSYALLGILASRTMWYIISGIAQPLGERKGTLIYRLFGQFMQRLPIPDLTDTQRSHIEALVQSLISCAEERYKKKQVMTNRFHSDLGQINLKLNQRLQIWWQLSFKEFREELIKVFKRDIPIKERSDWELWLKECKGEIEELTRKMISLETELNHVVYEIFGLDKENIALIEQETKYQYGEW